MKRIFILVCVLILMIETNVEAEKYYQLEKMVVLSRHNIRSPLSGENSILSQVTPHKWFKWTSAPSELSLKGGELETLMGQYFRQWLVEEGLMTDNYLPQVDEFRFYANSMQRTIATTQYFSSGMLPVANVRIEHKYPLNKMDPVFNPQLTYVNEEFKVEALKQIESLNKLNLEREYKLVEKVLDMKKSEYADKHFEIGDSEFVFEVEKEPIVKGSLNIANKVADALILQLYEEESTYKAGFNNSLKFEQWEQIARVKDNYGDVLFTTPIVAVNVANPLLKEINSELKNPNRKFSFLCGHDSNIASVLAALEVEEYFLPETIEKKTPIGSKLVIQKWKGQNGIEYISLNIVYQSLKQIRERTMLTLKNPPMIQQIKLKGLKENEDHLYKYSDVIQRFEKAIQSYYEFSNESKAA